MNYQDLYLFIKVVEKGSIVAAARYLDIPTSTLSRRIQSFEEDLGYKLVHRNAKRFGMTESGERFYHSIAGTVQDLEQRLEQVDNELSSLSGAIRVTAPVSLGQHFVEDWVIGFMEKNPGIQVEMFLSNDNVDLVKHSIDIAFRIGNINLNEWVSRELFHTANQLVASPSWLTNYADLTAAGSQPDRLNQVPLIVMKRNPIWRLTSSQGNTESFVPKARLRTDEIGFALSAALRGLGATCLPAYVLQHHLDAGELVQLLPEWAVEDRPVNMIYPHRNQMPTKTRAFIEHVIEQVRSPSGALHRLDSRLSLAG